MAYENLAAAYTEVDAAGRLVVSGPGVTVTDLDLDENVGLYKDFGAGNFDALDIDFLISFIGGSHGTLAAFASALQLTGSLVTAWSGLASTDIWIRANVAAGPAYSLLLMRGNGVASDQSTALSTDTYYYCTLVRTAANDGASLLIYSNAGRTTLVDTLTVAGYGTATWRYLFAVMGANSGSTGRALDFGFSSIEIQGGAAPPNTTNFFFAWFKVWDWVKKLLRPSDGKLAVAGGVAI